MTGRAGVNVHFTKSSHRLPFSLTWVRVFWCITLTWHGLMCSWVPWQQRAERLQSDSPHPPPRSGHSSESYTRKEEDEEIFVYFPSPSRHSSHKRVRVKSTFHPCLLLLLLWSSWWRFPAFPSPYPLRHPSQWCWYPGHHFLWGKPMIYLRPTDHNCCKIQSYKSMRWHAPLSISTGNMSIFSTLFSSSYSAEADTGSMSSLCRSYSALE